MTDFSFLELKFSPLRLDDRVILSEFLRKYPQKLTGYTFSALAAWRPFFQYEWVFAEPDLLIISCVLDSKPHRHLMQPVGTMSPNISEIIKSGAERLPYPLKIIGAGDRFLQRNPDLISSFTVAEDRSVSNYLYSADALALLSGRKYAKKRNLLAQASGLYHWSCQMLNQGLIDRCFSVLNSIFEEERPEVEGMLKRELEALECTLRHFDEFGQQGVLISVDDRPVAFSIYEAISPTTVAVHFERALRSYKGLYQVVNCETAKIVANQGFQFINREEDLGDPGLRDAKTSYHPIEIVPAYELAFRKQAHSADQ
jgi:uncharacterized protein